MGDETSGGRLAALAVGPQPGWAGAVEEALGPFGFAVVSASGPDEALAAVRARAFQLAVVALGGSPDGGGDLAARLTRTAPDLLVVEAETGATVAQAGRQAREAARRALVRVANHLAHDLNNPLGGLKLYVRLLERSLAQAKTEEAIELAGKIGRAVDQLAEILIEIRSYDRLPPSERAATRLETVLEECLAPHPAGRTERGGGT